MIVQILCPFPYMEKMLAWKILAILLKNVILVLGQISVVLAQTQN